MRLIGRRLARTMPVAACALAGIVLTAAACSDSALVDQGGGESDTAVDIVGDEDPEVLVLSADEHFSTYFSQGLLWIANHRPDDPVVRIGFGDIGGQLTYSDGCVGIDGYPTFFEFEDVRWNARDLVLEINSQTFEVGDEIWGLGYWPSDFFLSQEVHDLCGTGNSMRLFVLNDSPNDVQAPITD